MIFVLSLAFGAIFSWLISRYAGSFGLLDIPNGRSSHNLPTPRGGGIGILAAYIVSSAWLKLSLFIWLPAALMAVVSFFDDKLTLSPRTRLFFQFGSALVFAGTTLRSTHSLFILIVLIICFSIIITGTANFYNFMDGINGIAGITGIVAFCLLGLFAGNYAQQPTISLSAYCIAAACAGFLPFNVPRARVFMGDVGSVLLGFVFAADLVLLARTTADFLVVAGFLSTFYIDALTTLYVRKRNGERLSQAHRRHLYQLLANQLRIPHWKVSVCYGLVQLLIGVLLLTVHPYGAGVVAVTITVLASLWITVMYKIRQMVEVH